MAEADARATIEVVAASASATDAVIVHGAPPARVLDLVDESRAPVPFSCRGASCGICRVRIEIGAELLRPARRNELEILHLFDADPDTRLACQIVVEKPGRVRLYALEAVPEDC